MSDRKKEKETRDQDEGLDIRKVNVDFPEWIIDELDKESGRLGVTRQSLIKFWVTEKLDRMLDKRNEQHFKGRDL